MPDVRDQLANYFEASVERLTAEDVVQRGPGLHLQPAPRRRSVTRSVLAFAVAAVAVVVLIGGTGWLIGRETATAPERRVAALGPPLILPPSAETPNGFGAILIEIEDWNGLEGYQVLAGVWTADYELAGGAFWTVIDSDPFSARDVVHPPVSPYENTRDLGPSDWGLEDYMWDQTARLEPGVYRVTFWANPGRLHPYGSHIPAEPVERVCTVDVEVRPAETTSIVVTGIPQGGSACPTSDQAGQ